MRRNLLGRTGLSAALGLLLAGALAPPAAGAAVRETSVSADCERPLPARAEEAGAVAAGIPESGTQLRRLRPLNGASLHAASTVRRAQACGAGTLTPAPSPAAPRTCERLPYRATAPPGAV